MIDYYEFLQISPNADADTIHRVYRFLATRLHPDNPESGDAETFYLLKTAYDVLSNPDRRADYDVVRRNEPCQPVPLSTSIDFMDTLEGELNRRLALSEIELRMGFPRDYLDFTTWYLVKKGYVTRADNAEFTLTAEGVDFVETQRANLPVLNKMLTDGSSSPVPEAPKTSRRSAAPPDPIFLSSASPRLSGRRGDTRNGFATAAESYHAGAVEVCLDTIDRRAAPEDRRTRSRGRRSSD